MAQHALTFQNVPGGVTGTCSCGTPFPTPGTHKAIKAQYSAHKEA